MVQNISRISIQMSLSFMLIVSSSIGIEAEIGNSSTSVSSLLWDDIYTFTPSNNLLIIDTLEFHELWFHDLSFDVVSPESGIANITIEDPEGNFYYIYSGTVGVASISRRFGASQTGSYSLKIEVVTERTINLRVQIKIVESVIEFFNVDGKLILVNCFGFSQIETQVKKAFQLAKNDSCSILVSPISPYPSWNLPFINISLDDPLNQTFHFYEGIIEEPLLFGFQTNQGGFYEIDLDLIINSYSLNFILIIYLEYDLSNQRYYIPLEAQLFSATILFLLLLIPYLITRRVE